MKDKEMLLKCNIGARRHVASQLVRLRSGRLRRKTHHGPPYAFLEGIIDPCPHLARAALWVS
jgi:hypothetical protein